MPAEEDRVVTPPPQDVPAPRKKPAPREFVATFGRSGRIRFADGLHSMEVSRPVDPVRLKTVEQLASTLTGRTLESPETLALLGINLYELLFCHDHANEWFEDVYNKAPRGNVRLVLEFDGNDPDHRSLMALPWEYICVPEQRWAATPSYLANIGTVSVVRRLTGRSVAVAVPARPKVLVVDCLPKAPGNPRSKAGSTCPIPPSVSTDELLLLLEQRPELDVSCLRFPKQMRLQDEIDTRAPDVVHLIGHGRYDGHGGFEFCLSPETSLWESDQTIAAALSQTPPSLVVLQSCKGAEGRGRLHLAGIATLVTRGIPTVVGIQGEVEQRVAANFTMEFYEAMCLGRTVEEAVRAARLSLRSGDCFGLPVVFVQSDTSFQFPPPVAEQEAVAVTIRSGPPRPSVDREVAAQPVTKPTPVSVSAPASTTLGAVEPNAAGADAGPAAAAPTPGGASPLSVRFGRGGV